MKNVKMILGMLVMTLVTLTAISCKNGKKGNTEEDHASQMDNKPDGGEATPKSNTSQVQPKAIASYLELKNALVADDNEKAKHAGKILMDDLQSFDTGKYTEEQQKELKDILADAAENAEHISRSPIKHQREHFKVLSKDMIDMVAITGASTTLYQQFCPMYDNGSSWLSAKKRNKEPILRQ